MQEPESDCMSVKLFVGGSPQCTFNHCSLHPSDHPFIFYWMLITQVVPCEHSPFLVAISPECSFFGENILSPRCRGVGLTLPVQGSCFTTRLAAHTHSEVGFRLMLSHCLTPKTFLNYNALKVNSHVVSMINNATNCQRTPNTLCISFKLHY